MTLDTCYYLPGRRFDLWLTVWVLAKFGVQFLFLNPAYDLQRDEYLYLDEGRHLAWGFLEVPPAMAVQAWITQALGNDIFWVKFWPALFGALTLGVMGLIVRRLGGGLFALALAALGFIFSAYLRLNLLFQPNSLDVLAWTTAFYLLIRHIQTHRNGYLLALGLVLGIGFLNKYTMVFWAAGTAAALLLTPHRRLFTNKVFYLALGLGLLIVLPNLYWQYRHQFPVLTHMRELQESQLENVDLGGFLADQVLFCLGAIFVWLAGLGALLFGSRLKSYRVVGLAFLATMALFIWLQGKSYYTLGLYPVLLAAGAVAWESWTVAGWQKWTQPLLLALPPLALLPLLPLVFPVLPPQQMAAFALKYREAGLLRWEDGQDHALPQDYADMLGWQEMARLAARAYALVPAAERSQTLILCDNYGQAGALNYYGKKYALPRASSANASYLLWQPMPLSFRNVVLVGDEPDPEDLQQFREVGYRQEVRSPMAREQGTRVLLLRGASAVIVEKVNARFKHERAKFGL